MVDYRIYFWDDTHGKWIFLQMIKAYSTKQAKWYARTHLTASRRVAAFKPEEDLVAAIQGPPHPSQSSASSGS